MKPGKDCDWPPRRVPAGGDAAATVKRLTALVDDALARQGQPIREIVAVPFSFPTT